MQPNDPLVGGTVLRKPAIQSPNFVHGSTGWSINADGTAEFNAVQINGGSLTIISSTGGVFLYSGTPAAGNLILALAAASGIDAFGNTYQQGLNAFGTGGLAGSNMLLNQASIQWTEAAWVNNALVSVSVPGADPILTLTAPATNGAALNSVIQMAGPTSGGAAGIITLTASTFAFLVGLAGQMNLAPDPVRGIAVFDNTETWHVNSLSNSWVDNGSPYATNGFRMMPDNTVQMRGALKNGTKVDGTAMFTLPTGYRPPFRKIFPAPIATNGVSGWVLIEPTGVGSCYGIGAAAAFITLDTIRFPLM